MENASQKQSPGPRNGLGPFAAIIIVVIILALGGLYFFFTEESRIHGSPPAPDSPTGPQAQANT